MKKIKYIEDLRILRNYFGNAGIDNIVLGGSLALQIYGILYDAQPHDIDITIFVKAQERQRVKDILTELMKLAGGKLNTSYQNPPYTFHVGLNCTVVNVWVRTEENISDRTDILNIEIEPDFRLNVYDPATCLIMKAGLGREKDLKYANKLINKLTSFAV